LEKVMSSNADQSIMLPQQAVDMSNQRGREKKKTGKKKRCAVVEPLGSARRSVKGMGIEGQGTRGRGGGEETGEKSKRKEGQVGKVHADGAPGCGGDSPFPEYGAHAPPPAAQKED